MARPLTLKSSYYRHLKWIRSFILALITLPLIPGTFDFNAAVTVEGCTAFTRAEKNYGQQAKIPVAKN
jgi:hypothetical protein